jgi:hypothetical protein
MNNKASLPKDHAVQLEQLKSIMDRLSNVPFINHIGYFETLSSLRKLIDDLQYQVGQLELDADKIENTGD